MNSSGAKKLITLEERHKISELLKQNISAKGISKILNRSSTGINTELKRAGGRENYCPIKAHNILLANLEQKNKNTSDSLKGNKIPGQMWDRIKNLEMQMEILTDTIKEILKK